MKLCEVASSSGPSHCRSSVVPPSHLLQLGKPQYLLESQCRGTVMQLLVSLHQLCSAAPSVLCNLSSAVQGISKQWCLSWITVGPSLPLTITKHIRLWLPLNYPVLFGAVNILNECVLGYSDFYWLSWEMLNVQVWYGPRIWLMNMIWLWETIGNN